MFLKIFLKIIPLLILVSLLANLKRDLKKSPKIILWHVVTILILAVIYIPLYLNIKLKEWQVQVIFFITFIIMIFTLYKANAGELQYKKDNGEKEIKK